MKRPLAVLGFGLGGTLLIASLVGWHFAVLGAVLSLGALAATLAVRPLRRRAALPALCLAAAMGFTMFAVKTYREALPMRELAGRTVYVEGQVLEVYYNASGKAWEGIVLEVTGGDLPPGTRLDAVVGLENAPALWDTVAGELTLRLPLDARAGMAEGVYMAATATDWTGLRVAQTARRPWNAPFVSLRDKLSDAVGRHAQGDAGALIQGICFGDKRQLSGGAKEDFRAAGVSHLVAVSGLHLAALAAMLLWLLRRLRVPERWAAVAATPLIVGFVLLVGCPMSAVRSGVMCLTVLAGMAARRRADTLNSLGLAVLLIGVVQPFAGYDVGLLLSVGAVLGLVLLYPVLMGEGRAHTDETPRWRRRAGRVLRPVKKGLCASVAASVPTLPVLAVVFGALSVVAPVGNLLMVFPASLLMFAGLAATLLSLIPGVGQVGWLMRVVFLPARALAAYLLAAAHALASLPFAQALSRYAYVTVWAFAVAILVFAAARLSGGRAARRMLAACLCAVLAATLLLQVGMRGATAVTAAQTERGVAVLLERDGHRAAVAGEGGDLRALLRLCRARRIARLEFLAVAGDPNARELDDLCLFVRVDTVYALAPGDTVRFWEDGAVRLREGFVRVAVGRGSVLLSPDKEGDAAGLPEGWRMPTLAVFGRHVPRGAAGIHAGQGVLACQEKDAAAAQTALPWGLYPIRQTAQVGAWEVRWR